MFISGAKEENKMGVPVLILGRSGSGKSRSIKGLSDVGLIKVIEKELPFRNDLKCVSTADYNTIKKVLFNGKVDSYVIDDAGYLLTDEFMRRSQEKGYDKFTELANNFYDLIRFITTQLPRNKIVYLIMHEDENEVTGLVKPKTIGKLLDERVCVEGLFTIVLRCIDHQFYTNNSGCAKSPEEMFADEVIDNDLGLVDKTIRDYYGGLNNDK